MPSSPKPHHHGRPSPPSPRRSTMLIVSCCLLVGFSGFVLGLIAILGPSRGCSAAEPRLLRVSWGGEGRDGGGGLLVRDGEKVLRRRKVKGFVGIQTGFGSVGRRRSLRRTWMPSDREKFQRLEEDTGLVFRFVIGRTNDGAKMMELKKEVGQYDDFLLLDVEEEYSKLPSKTLAFFKAAYALYDAEFYVKADDDIYLRPDRLSLLLTKERSHSQTYIGCMKKGPVFTDPKLKWYEPLGYLLGKEYFFHAYGPIYALSAEVVASLVALRNNRC
ncbi:hypothetical protein BT93_F1374 [Corymbia citriodora subsp. variegata]|nr:hypothetical protein BT93_F1374 [Corymbia citriodora subsp. variegata]